MWQDVRDPDHGKLLFRYDPLRNLVQVGSRGVVHVVDLSEYRPSPQPPPQNRLNESPE
jgi:hypothetical protein